MTERPRSKPPAWTGRTNLFGKKIVASAGGRARISPSDEPLLTGAARGYSLACRRPVAIQRLAKQSTRTLRCGAARKRLFSLRSPLVDPRRYDAS